MEPNIHDEEEIIWLQPKERYPYLRESVCDLAQRRAFPIRLRPGGSNDAGPCTHLVAYAVLKPTARSVRGWFARRYWWVKKHDRFEGHGVDSTGGFYEQGSCPTEAVRTDTVVAGIPSLAHACTDDRNAGEHVHPALQPQDHPAREVYELSMPPGTKRWRRWMGLAVRERGQLFVSPRLAGMSNVEAMLCCSLDGVPVMSLDGITLVSADWLAGGIPTFAALRDKIIEQIAACAGARPTVAAGKA